jgi:hypothetical protein
VSTNRKQYTSSHINESVAARDDNAVDALADVLRQNGDLLYQCSHVPVEAGSVVIQFTKTPLRDLSDGRIWDGNGKLRGTIDYKRGQIRLKKTVVNGKRSIGLSYNFSS